jgi:hypothetical protein
MLLCITTPGLEILKHHRKILAGDCIIFSPTVEHGAGVQSCTQSRQICAYDQGESNRRWHPNKGSSGSIVHDTYLIDAHDADYVMARRSIEPWCCGVVGNPAQYLGHQREQT